MVLRDASRNGPAARFRPAQGASRMVLRDPSRGCLADGGERPPLALLLCLFPSLPPFHYTSLPMKDVYETTVRVRYAETDQMGFVYYGNFFTWFEVGRVELFRQMGFSYKEMETVDDCHIVVAEARCRYLRPARYDDLLCIRTRLSEARSRTLRFVYEILHDARRERLATGETTHVVCDRCGRPKSLPAKYRRLLAPQHAASARA